MEGRSDDLFNLTKGKRELLEPEVLLVIVAAASEEEVETKDILPNRFINYLTPPTNEQKRLS